MAYEQRFQDLIIIDIEMAKHAKPYFNEYKILNVHNLIAQGLVKNNRADYVYV